MPNVLPLVIAPDPRLSSAVSYVSHVDDKFLDLIEDMIATMKHHNGVGLAANQVGVMQGVAVIDVRRIGETYNSDPLSDDIVTELRDDGTLVLLNPTIQNHSVECSMYDEGCLSFPGVHLSISRRQFVTVEYTDTSGAVHAHLITHRLLSVCVQHEIDHLNGVTFLNYASPLKKQLMIKKVKKHAAIRYT